MTACPCRTHASANVNEIGISFFLSSLTRVAFYTSGGGVERALRGSPLAALQDMKSLFCVAQEPLMYLPPPKVSALI
jgi:hypothetical protein